MAAYGHLDLSQDMCEVDCSEFCLETTELPANVLASIGRDIPASPKDKHPRLLHPQQWSSYDSRTGFNSVTSPPIGSVHDSPTASAAKSSPSRSPTSPSSLSPSARMPWTQISTSRRPVHKRSVYDDALGHRSPEPDYIDRLSPSHPEYLSGSPIPDGRAATAMKVEAKRKVDMLIKSGTKAEMAYV